MSDELPNLSYLRATTAFRRVERCPWCESGDVTTIATRADGLEVQRCGICSLAFLAELPDDVSVFYDDAYFERNPGSTSASAPTGYDDYDRAYPPMSFRWLVSLITVSVGSPGRLFDLGAATGTFLEMARYAGFSVAGSELTIDGAEAARAKGLDVRSGAFEPQAWEAGSYDVVSALEVLEHVTDLRGTIDGLSRLLKADGALVFMVPNLPQDIVDEYGDATHDLRKSLEHTLYFDPASLEAVFRESFPDGSLHLYTPVVVEDGQRVSYAIGVARPTRVDDPPESRLFDVLGGRRAVDSLRSADEAMTVALTAAKFSNATLADAAIDRASRLEADELDLDGVRAQVMKNRGEFLRSIETLEPSLRSSDQRRFVLAAALLLEILRDFTGTTVDDPTLGGGFREIHRRLELHGVLDRAVSRVESIEGELRARAESAERMARAEGTAADALRSELAQTAAHLETTRALLERADADLVRLQANRRRLLEQLESGDHASTRVRDLEAETERLSQTLNEIYESRTWKLASLPWRLRGAIRSGPDAAPTSVQAPGTPPRATPPPPAPVVSVIMPVYNKGATLRSSLDSVLAQTYPHVEVIVWDDGSTDAHTLAELAAIDQDGDVRVIHARNAGVIRARNSAMRLATGDLLVCVDPDDRLRPTYLEKAVTFLESHPDVSIVYPWQETVGDRTERWETQDLDPTRIAESNHVPVCAVFRREVFHETGGFAPQMSDGFEDWEFWTHAAELGFRGRVIPEPLFEYEYRWDAGESRDAAARKKLEDLTRRIQDLHPRISSPRARTHRRTPPARLSSFTPQLPAGKGRPIVLFLPWYTVGGADRVVESLAGHWSASRRTVVAITTLGVGPGMDDRIDDLLSITPFAYQLTSLAPERYWYDAVSRILAALPPATIVNVGSSWLHEHAQRIKGDFPDTRIIDQQFNDAGHIDGNTRAATWIDHTITAYHGLEDAFLADGRDPASVSTVYVGIEPIDVDEARVAHAREDLGIGPDTPYVLFIGRLAEEKRPEWLMAVADALEPRGIEVVAVGSGPLADELAPEFGRRSNMTWTPYVEDVAPLLRGAQASLIPSRIEGIPLAAMESLAVGTPVVATAVGGLPELEHVEGIHIVDPTDVHEFAATVERVAASNTAAAIVLPPDLTTAGMLAHYDELIDPR